MAENEDKESVSLDMSEVSEVILVRKKVGSVTEQVIPKKEESVKMADNEEVLKAVAALAASVSDMKVSTAAKDAEIAKMKAEKEAADKEIEKLKALSRVSDPAPSPAPAKNTQAEILSKLRTVSKGQLLVAAVKKHGFKGEYNYTGPVKNY